jgi:hypothetical protein
MPLLTELDFLFEQVFYKYIAPTALPVTNVNLLSPCSLMLI